MSEDIYSFKPVAHIRTGFPEKFGIPRQASLVPDAKGRIVFEMEFRHPDIIKGIEEFERLPEIQYSIVQNALSYLEAGGELVYSTCTVRKAENDEIKTSMMLYPLMQPADMFKMNIDIYLSSSNFVL